MTEARGFSLIIATFPNESQAATAVEHLLSRHRAERDSLPAAALVTKNKAGDLTIQEVGDIGAKTGAVAGALVGGLVGLLSRRRSVVASAGVGALLGGVAAKKLDTGIPDPRLEAIGHTLEVATGAAVAVVDDSTLSDVEALLVSLGGTVRHEPFAHDTDFFRQLQAGNLAGAAGVLANAAESSVSEAARGISDRAEGVAAATGTSTAEGVVDFTTVAATESSIPVPEQPPAQLADDTATLPSDAGGLARNDIDPAAAGLANLRPPL